MSRACATLLLLALACVRAPREADAMCNVVPTAIRGFASSRGEVDRPFASPGRAVRLRLGPCDATAFVPDATTVEVTFLPPTGSATTIVVPPEDVISATATELVFAFPDSAALGMLRTGPATIVARVAATEVARIDRLGTRDADCGLVPSPVFPGFTALPPPNRFHCVAAGACPAIDDDPTRIRATIDAAGNLLVPWDWGDVFPPARGFDPIARLVHAGQSALEAFAPPDPRAGRGIIIPSVAYVSAHALTGNVLPPLLDVGPPIGTGPFPGSTIVGTVDSLDGVLRISRMLGDDPATEIFDLHDRLEAGVGAIVISDPTAVEAPLVDLRSLTASTHVTAIEEPTRGPRTIGLLVYDNRSGALGRLPALTTATSLPRRIGVSDTVAAYYDSTSLAPTLTLFDVGRLRPVAGLQAVPATDLVVTNLFGSDGSDAAPVVGSGVGGGFAGAERRPTVFDVATGATEPGRLLGDDLVETAEGIVNRRYPERFAAFGGELAPLGPDRAGRVFAADGRAVFLVCDGPCGDADGTSRDRVLVLLERDGSTRELARNVGAPFVFTGTIVGLVAHEDASFGSAHVDDLDGDAVPTGTYLRLYDLTRDRPVVPRRADGRPLALADALPELVAGRHVLTVVVDEAANGPLNCDTDASDHVVTLVNALTGRVFDTREPAARPAGLGRGRGLTTFAQTESVLGVPFGTTILNVARDSDGDEVPDAYDDCPLRADPTQADSDGNGIGDVCDPACADDGCAAAGMSGEARRCASHVRDALRVLLDAALPTPAEPRVAPAALAVAARKLRGCAAPAFSAIGACADSVDGLVGTASAPGCLVTAVQATVRAVVDAEAAGDAAACAARLRKSAASAARRRFRVLARCLAAADAVRPDETVDAVARCGLDAANQRRLGALGRMVRRHVVATCRPDHLTALTVCGGTGRPTIDTLVDAAGRDGCVVGSIRLAIDALLREASSPERTGSGAAAAPCPSPPRPSPTPTLGPASIAIHVGAGGTRPPATLTIGWNGVDRPSGVLGGVTLMAGLGCAPGATTCAVHAPLADVPVGAPVPVVLGQVPMCLTFEGDGDADGTFDTESGTLDLGLPLRLRIFGGYSIDQPCPFCFTADGRPDVGEYGTCVGGPNGDGACRVEQTNQDLGAAGGTSSACPPLPNAKIEERSLTLRAATGTATLAPDPASPRCRGAGFTDLTCPCDTCNGPSAEPCTTDADCPPSGGAPGICGGRWCITGTRDGLPCAKSADCPNGVCARRGTPTRRNPCSDGICTEVAGGDGVCLADPLESHCAEAPWRTCTTNLDCPFGLCLADHQHRCFPDTIVRVGSADPPVDGHAEPTLVGAFCLAPTYSSAVNTSFGLPGPGAITLPVSVDYRR